jgi:hypothetical protein
VQTRGVRDRGRRRLQSRARAAFAARQRARRPLGSRASGGHRATQLKCGNYSGQIRDDEKLWHYHQAQKAVRALPATATTVCELKEFAYVPCFKIVLPLLLCAAKTHEEAVDQFHAPMQVWVARLMK